ncbi:family-interacting 4A-like isoform X4 [Octopus vulgaris]|uniref:Family-interacting 4A-like isoform X4 n=1 Tax=Octopus vulgaris TaxID=6645 RepID=A0AA36F2X6_OCTVU|nr:family-interacting 4A-like isoform X4 [Octopus vulgaris]
MLCIHDMDNQTISSAGSSESLNRLKTVFEVCDEKNDGYITIEHFEKLIREHFGEGESEELHGIIQFLDPEKKGKINFSDFCQGVQRILSLQGNNLIKRSWSDVSDDELNFEKNAESSETSTNTYAEYDINTDEDACTSLNTEFFPTPVGSFDVQLQVASEDDRDSFISGRSSEVTENSRHDITDEDNYEDFGEGEELESQSEADIPSHTRGHMPNKRLSSAAYASQLQRASRSPSRRNSIGSDELIDDIDGNFEVLNDKVRSLEKQISLLTESQMKNDDKHQRLKEENCSLIQNDIVYRVHILEEQLREMEIRSDEQVKVEQKKHKEYVGRHDRDKAEQLIYLSHRLQDVDRHYETTKEEATRLRNEVEKLKSEKLELHDKLTETQYSYATLLEDNEKQQAEMATQSNNFEHERKATAQLLDELGKELKELRQYKIETEHIRQTQKNALELPDKCRELEEEIKKLQEENRTLRDSNDDLNVQLLNRCMEEGRRLLKYNGAISLADEIDNLSKEELMNALKEQQDVNDRLKKYVDKIILKILEKNQSLLEINQ